MELHTRDRVVVDEDVEAFVVRGERRDERADGDETRAIQLDHLEAAIDVRAARHVVHFTGFPHDLRPSGFGPRHIAARHHDRRA